jgi:hypothetical protein
VNAIFLFFEIACQPSFLFNYFTLKVPVGNNLEKMSRKETKRLTMFLIGTLLYKKVPNKNIGGEEYERNIEKRKIK